jgi:hypothetical protein
MSTYALYFFSRFLTALNKPAKNFTLSDGAGCDGGGNDDDDDD